MTKWTYLASARNCFGDPRGGDAEMAHRIGQGEPGLRYEVHREGRAHGREPASAAPHAQLFGADMGGLQLAR